MALPWKANNRTNVASKAAIDHGPSRRAWLEGPRPARRNDRRQACDNATGMTMYSATEVSSVFHGTAMADKPSRARRWGEGEHHDGVVERHLRQREQRITTGQAAPHETMAVQGAAANRIKPAT